MRPVPHRNGREDGYILITVLGVMILLTGVMAAASVLLRSSLHSAWLGDETVKLDGAAQGGLEIVGYQLFSLKANPRLVDGRSIRFAHATITPHLKDEAGKVDLNGADPKLLQSLFASVGIDSASIKDLMTHIVEVRGETEQSGAPQPGAPPGGNPGDPSQLATQAQPQQAQPQQAAQTSPTIAPGQNPAQDPNQPGGQPQQNKKRRGFQSVDQLLDFPEMTRADMTALAPYLTVFNPDGKVDILTAGEDVLKAIPGISPAIVDDILARRPDADKDTISKLESSLPGDAKTFVKSQRGPAYAVRIDTTLASGRHKTLAAVIGPAQGGSDPYYVLDWGERSE